MSNVYTSNDQNNSSETSVLKRDFKGIWIPEPIYLYDEINALEKYLWAEIDSLFDESKGGCYVKENHFCEILNINRRYLYKMLKHLKELGLVEDVAFNGREKIRKAVLSKNLTLRTRKFFYTDVNGISRHFKGIWIPKAIYLHRNISALEKLLWAEIDSLYDESKGGCYAKEEHLCKILNIQSCQLYRLLKNLKEVGLIEDVAFNGRQKIRKSVLPQELKFGCAQQQCTKVQYSNEVCTKLQSSSAQNDSATPYIYRDTNIETHKEILSNESTKKVANAPFPPPKKKTPDQKIFVSAAVQKKYTDKGKGIVKMDQDEWDKLVQEFGEAQVATIATKLSEYMVSSGKIYKDHYLTIRNWIRRDQEKQQQPKPSYAKDPNTSYMTGVSASMKGKYRPKTPDDVYGSEEE